MVLTRMALPSLALCLTATAALRASSDGSMAITVLDRSGSPVGKATILLSSPSQIGGPRTGLTDALGKVRFPRLMPGVFRVVVSASGFEAQTLGGVAVAVDQTVAVNVRLAPVGGTVVDVVSRASQVDATTVTSGTQITSSQLDSLPVARTQTAALALAPGVVDTGQGGDPALTVSLNRDNRGFQGARNNTYMIDGIDVTSPEVGQLRTHIAPELIQVQDVKTGAITAEYTARAGLFSNVTTKAGGNAFSGGLSLDYMPSSLATGTRAGRFDQGERMQRDLGFWHMGPILKDRLWYVANLQQVKETLAFTLSPTVTSSPGEKRTGTAQDGWRMFAKLTWQATPADLVSFAFNKNPYHFDNLDQPGVPTNRGLLTQRGGDRLTFAWTHSWEQLFLDFRLAKHHETDSQTALYVDAGPANTLRSATAMDARESSLGGNGMRTIRAFNRNLARLDLTWLFDAAGTHTLKAGIQAGSDRFGYANGVTNTYDFDSFREGTYTWATLPSSNVKSQKTNFLPWLNGNAVATAAFRAAGFIQTGVGGTWKETDLDRLRFDTPNPYGGYYGYRVREDNWGLAEPRATSQGFYVQDQWSLGSVTLSPGIRFDQYDYFEASGKRAFSVGFQAAPRIGLTWDPRGDGHSKLYAYFGRYVDPIRMDMIRFTGNNTGSIRREEIYAAGQWWNFLTRGGPFNIDACFADDFKLSKTDELRLGWSADLRDHFTLDLTYTARRDFDIVEDWNPALYTDPQKLEDEARGYFKMGSGPTASLTPQQQAWISAFRSLALPASAFAGGGYTGEQNVARKVAGKLNFVLANLPGGERTYRSLDVTLTRREANHWGGFISASLIRARGNTWSMSNADQQGDYARYDPRLPYQSGRLDGSPDWMAKAYGYVRFASGFLLGGTLNAHSGFRYTSSEVLSTRIQVKPALEDLDRELLGAKRNPFYCQFDLRAQYAFPLGRGLVGEVNLDIRNLPNRQSPTELSEGLNVRPIAPVADTPFRYQAPRTVLVGFRLKY